MREYAVLIRFDAIDNDKAMKAYDMMREVFCNDEQLHEVDALIETGTWTLKRLDHVKPPRDTTRRS
jgi:hypothetical protein